MRINILLMGLIFTSTFCYSCEGYNLPDNVVKEYNNIRPVVQDVPKGMKLVWGDEFDGTQLDRTKWSTQYYSTADFREKSNYQDFLGGTLPEPGMEFTGSSLILYTDDLIPTRPYWESIGRKISSIQTYDWRLNKNMLGDKVGGYIEARIRRNATDNADLVNTAFWLDSPGPDLKYFMEEGYTAFDVEGIRPHGQAFEIDLCENLNTEIVLHGNVTPTGIWQNCIAQHFVGGMDFKNRWVTHSMLWTPTSLKFYIDGVLKAEWSDPNGIKSPNHYMNIYFGAYGKGGKTTMEVDYIRFYQWDLADGNELPNGNFEYDDQMFPWEGEGKIVATDPQDGAKALSLAPGQKAYQYLYVDSDTPYTLDCWSNGTVEVKVENIIPVSGLTMNEFKKASVSTSYEKNSISFTSKKEKAINKATIKITLHNTGDKEALVDNLILKK